MHSNSNDNSSSLLCPLPRLLQGRREDERMWIQSLPIHPMLHACPAFWERFCNQSSEGYAWDLMCIVQALPYLALHLWSWHSYVAVLACNGSWVKQVSDTFDSSVIGNKTNTLQHWLVQWKLKSVHSCSVHTVKSFNMKSDRMFWIIGISFPLCTGHSRIGIGVTGTVGVVRTAGANSWCNRGGNRWSEATEASSESSSLWSTSYLTNGMFRLVRELPLTLSHPPGMETLAIAPTSIVPRMTTERGSIVKSGVDLGRELKEHSWSVSKEHSFKVEFSTFVPLLSQRRCVLLVHWHHWGWIDSSSVGQA